MGGRDRGRNLVLVLGALALVVLAAVVVGAVRYLGAVPPPVLAVRPVGTTFPGAVPGYSWPAGAQGALSLEGVGTFVTAGGQTPTPIASVAKIMAALVILHDHPLTLGEQGPAITVSPADVANYQSELAASDSVIAVHAGEQLSELQALEAALVPSADNVIEMLARWDAGSTSSFVAKMSAMARHLGLSQTHYAGPSGVNPATTSTAVDQVRLAGVALANPVFAHIVSLTQVTLPDVGVAYNVDADLGHDGIVGVKTGWVPAGGASFVFAARHTAAGRPFTVIGAVVGVQGGTPLPSALAAGRQLAAATATLARTDQVMRPGMRVGSLSAPWSASVPVVTAGSATLLGWPGATVSASVTMRRGLSAPVASGTHVGELVMTLGTEQVRVPLVTSGRLGSPSASWRLTR